MTHSFTCDACTTVASADRLPKNWRCRYDYDGGRMRHNCGCAQKDHLKPTKIRKKKARGKVSGRQLKLGGV